MGPGINGKPWISCLGNHDYGGHHYYAAWDQQITYTWGGVTDRWILPALYYHQRVSYPTRDFTIDYFILDTNVADAANNSAFGKMIGHNVCNSWEKKVDDCGPFGPSSAETCANWFLKLWKDQLVWLEKHLDESDADWQIIMTHFPPETCVHQPQFAWDLKRLSDEYGVDLIVAGHRHVQELHPTGENAKPPCFGTGVPYVVAGGGGGITSDGEPGAPWNHDEGITEYGFMDMTINKTLIYIESISYKGEIRDTMTAIPRARKKARAKAVHT
jgi:hypothetical protein